VAQKAARGQREPTKGGSRGSRRKATVRKQRASQGLAAGGRLTWRGGSETAGGAAPTALPLGVEEPATANRRRRGVERERVSSRTRVGGGRGSDDRMGASPMLDGRANCGCSLTTRWLQTEARGIFSEWSVTRREAGRVKRGAGSGSGPITLTRRDCTLLLDRVLELQRHGRLGRTAQPPHRKVGVGPLEGVSDRFGAGCSNRNVARAVLAAS
jgi:hypothetical protein